MKKGINRIISIVLSITMVLSLTPFEVFANTNTEGSLGDEKAYFDFEASEYEVHENDGKIKIKIVRHGRTDEKAKVTFKVADFLSSYEDDYVVLDQRGKPLEKVYGQKPSVSDFTFEENSEAQNEGEETANEADSKEKNTESVNAEQEEPQNAESEQEEPQDAEEEQVEEDEIESTGSSLLDAQRAYLKVPKSKNKVKTESAIKETINDMYNYFLTAEGALGAVNFKKGEKEKTVTVKIFNNKRAEQDKIFMLALMSAEGENVTIAPNATTYVAIVDDEEQEKSRFDLEGGDINLTSEAPEVDVTIRRSGATQYFTTVYLSTVKETAKEEAYENLSYKPVAFIPGEEEKTVKIKAYDFNQEGTFGLRLSSETDDNIGNYYAQVSILGKNERNDVLLNTENSDIDYDSDELPEGAMAVSGSKVLGSETWYPAPYKSHGKNLPGVNIEGGWDHVIQGDGGWNKDDTYLQLWQEDSKRYSLFHSKEEQDLRGVKSIKFVLDIYNKTRGRNTKYKKYYTYFETSTQKTTGTLDQFEEHGNLNVTQKELELDDTGGFAYFQFWTRPYSSGFNNPKATLYKLTYVPAKYTFEPKDSAEVFPRKLYDFTQGSPHISSTYYENATTTLYNPGSVVVKNANGTNISGFYANNNERIWIEAKEEMSKQRHLYLKGVYFTESDIDARALYDRGYRRENVYYVEAKGGVVSLVPNQDFIGKLKRKDVIDDFHKDFAINIFPVFGQEEVKVSFLNTDTEPGKEGKYNETYKASHIKNIIEGYKQGKVQKKQKTSRSFSHKSFIADEYYMDVPKGSVIRMEVQPISTRTANGVSWLSDDNKQRGGHVYYKVGDQIVGTNDKAKETVTFENKAMADVAANENITIRPVTGEQTFKIGYYSPAKNSIPNDYKGAEGLKNAVINWQGATSSQGTDQNGDYTFNKPYIGMEWKLRAQAPSGYYTQWVDMTGDENGDGYLDEQEQAKLRHKTAMAEDVYGNNISGIVDRDHFRLNYYFLPLIGTGGNIKTGRVVRASETFYQLAKKEKSGNPDIPLEGAYVDLAGFIGTTDADGRYSIDCQNLPLVGRVSTTITAGNTTYSSISKLQRYTTIRLDALDTFKANSIEAYYDKGGNIVEQSIITKDDFLTLSLGVTGDSAIQPTSARFFIYDKEGQERFKLESKDGYTTNCVYANDELTATLRFNPKTDISNGDRIYVQFADQNDKWTNVIDAGYVFISELTLDKFLLPMLGGTSIVSSYNALYDIIGNPLGGVNVGSLKGFNVDSYKYTPAGASKKDANKYTWVNTDYTFGWEKAFSGSKKKTSKETDDEKLKAYLKEIYDGTSKGKEPPQKSKYQTAGSFKWNVTPSVGFKLTLSSREPGKTYFEDLVFFVRVDFGVSASQTIQLPIGISVLIGGGLSGNVVGVYHMYVDYQDPKETEDAVLYNTDNFSVFKKTNNRVRREGYIFLDPKVDITLGVQYGIVGVNGKASFAFDMDFHFKENDTLTYGDVTVDLGWSISLMNFDVYTKSYKVAKEKMFSSGTNEHIDFGYQIKGASMRSIQDYMNVEDSESLVLDKPSPRDYLENRSEWMGEEDDFILPVGVRGASALQEKVLRRGVPSNPNVKLIEYDSGRKILMVFVDDDETRTSVNKRALYYSIYDGNNWSNPVSVDNDSTLDDYPNLSDLGDGRILITWSSADKVFDKGTNMPEVARHMNLKARFFNTSTGTLGDVMEITKTTEKDYAADVLAHAAYDSTAKKILLYYTKTEYDKVEKIETKEEIKEEIKEIGKAASVNAYMIYDDENQKWSDGASYTNAELANMSNEEKEAYKNNWYGQRFLDLRTNSATGTPFPRVVDTSSTSYNELALFAWTVDWDKDLNTLHDRDVFMQIYSFKDNKFTHIIRVTPERAAYSAPKFARSNSATYLFYGETGVQDSNATTETALKEHGEIKYLNVSDLIKEEKYEIKNEGGSEYYVFEYDKQVWHSKPKIGTSDELVMEDTHKSEKAVAQAATAVKCDNPGEYDVKVSADGKMYLFWTDSVKGARQILASMFVSGDSYNVQESGNDSGAETSIPADITNQIAWSEPVILTSAGKGEYYAGMGAAVVGDMLFTVSMKGDTSLPSQTELICGIFNPMAKLKMDSVEIVEEFPHPKSKITLRAKLKNEGLMTYIANAGSPTEVTFQKMVNGVESGDPVAAQIKNSIPGGSEAIAVCNMELPEDISGISFTASIAGQEGVNVSLEPKGKVAFVSGEAKNRVFTEKGKEKFSYDLFLRNEGNATLSNLKVAVMAGKNKLGEKAIDSIEPNQLKELELEFTVPSDAYNVNESGMGSLDLQIVVENGDGTEMVAYNEKLKRTFDQEAIDLISRVEVENNGNYRLQANETRDIKPVLRGVEADKLDVLWLNSSDEGVAYINGDNSIVAVNNGNAVFSGIVVPKGEVVSFENGVPYYENWEALIPSNKMKEVSIKVSVGYQSSGGHRPPNKTETQVTKPEIPEKVGSTPFKDVEPNIWYSNAVKFVYERKLFAGTSAKTFEPKKSLTRAMLAAVLWRAEGKPQSEFKTAFNDTKTDAYYANALSWAADSQLVKGITSTKFAPDDNITREQIATIIYRYAKYRGDVPKGAWAINLDYKDNAEISDWATEAVMYCRLKGIMVGNDKNTFNPKANATRAETAMIIQRFLENFENKNK